MLNEQQQEFQDLVLSGEFSKLRLKGEAGTGKTYVIIDTILKLLEAGQKVIVAAPTHTALNCIQDKFRLARYFEDYDVQFCTVASLLARYGMRSSTGEIFFRAPQPTSKLYSADYIFVDELSMLSAKELDQLLASPAKIVLSGDLDQIPVVLQKKPDWENINIQVFELTAQERQSGAIYELAKKSRATAYFPTEADADYEEILLVDSKESLLEQMIAQMKASQKEDYSNYRFLTYKNCDVDYVNSTVHNELFGELPFYVDEYLMLRQTGIFGYNGEICKVVSVGEAKYSELYKVTEFLITLSNGSEVTLISQEDLKKIELLKIQTQALLKQALAQKATDQIECYFKELELLDCFIGWQYVYSSTVHKSQGSTVDHIYLDISSFKSAGGKKSLLYVGISRAASTLTFTTLKNDRYVPKRKNRKPALKMWKCTETGRVSTGAGLAKYQRKLGIDTTKRVFVEVKA